jgi:hypothetical protein
LNAVTCEPFADMAIFCGFLYVFTFAYPSPFVVPISLSGQTGFEAMVDTGASHSVMKHSLPFLWRRSP